MDNEAPSIWTMDRQAIEASLIAGRSPRSGPYTTFARRAIEQVLKHPDFETLSPELRSNLYTETYRKFQEHAAGSVGPSSPIIGSEQPSLTSLGYSILIGSVVICLYAYFGFGTSVHSDSEYIGGSYIEARDTINIGLLQNQLMVFLLSLVGLLSGVLVLLADWFSKLAKS